MNAANDAAAPVIYEPGSSNDDLFAPIEDSNAANASAVHATVRATALALAAEGLRVFPLPPRKKQANMPEWQKRATSDRAQIEQWFPLPLNNDLVGDPEGNIGIATGNGLLVLDEDPRHGSQVSVTDLQSQHGPLPETRTVRTPSGGRHRYYRVPADRRVPNSCSKLSPGLDIRGDGGYVAAPPSATDQGAYICENPGAPIADAPPWLIELATKPRAPKEPNNSGTGSTTENAKHDLTVADARKMLKHLDASCNYETWFGVCVALRRMAKGAQDSSSEAEWFAALDDWSRASQKYPGHAEVEAKWREADKRPHGYGLGHMIELAKAGGYELPARQADPNVFPLVPATTERAPLVFQTQGNGKPLSNVNNAVTALAQQTILRVVYDEFLCKALVQWPEDAKPRPLRDEDIIRVQIGLQRNGLMTLSGESAFAAIKFVARRNSTNCVADYLNLLTWDGTRRVSLLMPRGFGTAADRYCVRAGRNMLVAMVARALQPGCQVDEAIVLEGPQGSLKSSALRIIGGDYFAELTALPNSKDFEQQLQGVWLGEFAELSALRRTEDIERIKQFVTCRSDHVRLPYGHVVSDFPRRTVLCGSTNSEWWLHDPTGGRRFIPVKVGQIDIGWLRDNRDQLFAEAVALYKAERKWWVYPRAAAIAEQEARTPEDPWLPRVRKYLYGRQEISDLSELLTYVLQITLDRQTKTHQTRVGTLLRRLGCVQQNQRRVDGRRCRPWSVPAEFAKQSAVLAGLVQFPAVPSNEDLTGGAA